MKYHPEILYAEYNFVRSVGWHLEIKKMCSEMVKNRPKSAECALSMVLLGVAMATLIGLMKYLFLFLIGDIWLF